MSDIYETNKELFQLIKVRCKQELACKYLNGSFRKDLYNILKERLENKCFKDYGYIHIIYEPIHILNNVIGKIIPNPIFEVHVDTLVYKPRIGDVLQVPVHLIFHNGLFLNFFQIRILVPTTYLSKFSVVNNFTQISFVENGNPKNIITKGTVTNVKITDMRFMNGTFSCIAELINILSS